MADVKRVTVRFPAGLFRRVEDRAISAGVPVVDFIREACAYVVAHPEHGTHPVHPTVSANRPNRRRIIGYVKPAPVAQDDEDGLPKIIDGRKALGLRVIHDPHNPEAH